MSHRNSLITGWLLLLILIFSATKTDANNQTGHKSDDSLICKEQKQPGHNNSSTHKKHNHHKHSEHNEGEIDRNWDLIIGVGAYVSPLYIGSDKFSVIPLPYIEAFYKYNIFKFFLNLEEGIGGGAQLIKKIPVSYLTGINLGRNTRNSKEISFLRGTPSLESFFYWHNSLKADFKYGSLWTKIIYAPISSTGNNDDRYNKTFDGILFNIDWQMEKLLIPFYFNLKTGISFMNKPYTEANYTLYNPTDKLSSYKATSGPNDVHASLDFAMFFSEHTGIGIISEGCYLIKNAHKSVFIQKAYQLSIGSAFFYRF